MQQNASDTARVTLDANADEYGDAPATQLRIDDDEGGHGELGMTTACKTLAAYGYDAYQQLSMTEIQREMPRGIPMGDAKRVDNRGRNGAAKVDAPARRALAQGMCERWPAQHQTRTSSRNADAERARQPRPGNAHESA